MYKIVAVSERVHKTLITDLRWLEAYRLCEQYGWKIDVPGSFSWKLEIILY